MLATLESGPISNHVTFVDNSAGHFAYISVGGKDEVLVYQRDLGSSPKLLATIKTGDLPHGIWGSGDGSRVYVGLENGDAVQAIDTSTNKIIATIPVGQLPQALVYVPGATQDDAGTANLEPLGLAADALHLHLVSAVSSSNAQASVSVNSLGLIDNLQIAATGLEPGKKYTLVLVGGAEPQGLAAFTRRHRGRRDRPNPRPHQAHSQNPAQSDPVMQTRSEVGKWRPDPRTIFRKARNQKIRLQPRQSVLINSTHPPALRDRLIVMTRRMVKIMAAIFSLVFMTHHLLAAPQDFQSGAGQVTLLELYTSEGCSSCPPAETWLSRLKDSPELWKSVVPVAFHVDYWDYLGWQRSLGDKGLLGQAARRYANSWGSDQIYTPGVVRNGREWKEWRTTDKPAEQTTAKPGVLHATSTDGSEWKITFIPAEGAGGDFGSPRCIAPAAACAPTSRPARTVGDNSSTTSSHSL